MTKVEFDKFEDQCYSCPCYTDNAGPGEKTDPDSDCALGHDVNDNKFCHDCGD